MDFFISINLKVMPIKKVGVPLGLDVLPLLDQKTKNRDLKLGSEDAQKSE